MRHFFRKLDTVDRVIERGASVESAADLVALIADLPTAVYALNKLDATWLEPLETIGYFRDLSSVETSREGVPDALWPASLYLKRIAENANGDARLAHILQRVISFVPNPGSYAVFREIVGTAILLPREMRRGVVPLIQRAISSKLSIEFSNITSLVIKLAEEGEVAAALRLFASVFSVFPADDSDGRKRQLLFHEPRSFMDVWHYAHEMEKCLPALTRSSGLRLLPCLSSLLADCIRLQSSHPSFQGPDDLSYIWRPAIEPHDQNIHEDRRDCLVSAVRDCAAAIASDTPANFVAVAEFLDSQQWFVFTRILLHLLSTAPTAPLHLIGYYSAQPYLFSEVTVRHEYSLLLKSRFGILTPDQQSAVLKMIDNGPDKVGYERGMRRHLNRSLSKEEVGAYVRRWGYDWMSFIANDLPAEWRVRYDALQREFGLPDHPDFPHYMSHGFGTGGLVPVDSGEGDGETVDKVLEMHAAGLLGEMDQDGHELNGLLEGVRAGIISNPEIAIQRVEKIALLPPRFLAAITAALATSTLGAADGLISTLLRLSTEMIKALSLAVDSSLKDLLRDSLTSVLDLCTRNDGHLLKREHLTFCRNLAAVLLSTVTLLPVRRDGREDEDFDPLFWGINSVDGRVVEGAIKLALLERKLYGDVDYVPPMWLMAALSEKLAAMPPDEVNVTAILGYRFPWLVHLSRSWATEHAESIFPQSPESRWRWEAAWCSYVGFSGAYNDVLDILGGQYAKAARELGVKHAFKKSRLDPEQGLAHHLGIYYWRQLIDLRSPLLVDFLKFGGERPIRAFISYVGRGMSDVKDIPTHVTESLRALGGWMVRDWRSRRRGATKALAAFGWWFPHEFLGDAAFRLRLLCVAARRAGTIDNLDRVLGGLELLASEHSGQVVDCLLALVRGTPKKDGGSYYLASRSFGILEKAAPNATASVAAKIGEIADHFGSEGHFEYRQFAGVSSDIE